MILNFAEFFNPAKRLAKVLGFDDFQIFHQTSNGGRLCLLWVSYHISSGEVNRSACYLLFIGKHFHHHLQRQERFYWIAPVTSICFLLSLDNTAKKKSPNSQKTPASVFSSQVWWSEHVYGQFYRKFFSLSGMKRHLKCVQSIMFCRTST